MATPRGTSAPPRRPALREHVAGLRRGIVSSTVFFAGLQLDAMIRNEAEGTPHGDARSRAR